VNTAADAPAGPRTGLIVAALACLIPSARAVRIDPLIALRADAAEQMKS
jgi:hypothetical protein